MKISSCLLIACVVIFVISCETVPGVDPTIDQIVDSTANEEDPLIDTITGFIQKGPFLNGASILISELDEDLVQTGMIYTAQTRNYLGSFEVILKGLESEYIDLRVDGFYFNEVLGEKSSSQLTLYALSDCNDRSTLNVNVVSHLERLRTKYLVAQGTSFAEAKRQAQQDVLGVFSFSKEEMIESELLDISAAGDDNAILLAISLILLGNGSTVDLSGLLADLSLDLEQDGIISDTEIGIQLATNASLLNQSVIRDHLETRYDDLGIEAEIPFFESYVTTFLENAGFEIDDTIVYPEFSDNGENILYGEKKSFIVEENYSMAADLSSGSTLKIILKNGAWGFATHPTPPVNWTASAYNEVDNSQEFVTIKPGVNSDLMIMFLVPTKKSESQSLYASDSIHIEYYENGASIPTRVKKISVADNH